MKVGYNILTMNIFYLDQNPKRAAEYHCDKHCIKMILESAQLLCSAHRVLDGVESEFDGALYKATHINHPCAIWTRQSSDNYSWLFQLMIELNNEFVRRYNKKAPHATITKLREVLCNVPNNMDWRYDFTHPPQCMPQEFRDEDTVIAYRSYYKGAKSSFASWTNTARPEWFD